MSIDKVIVKANEYRPFIFIEMDYVKRALRPLKGKPITLVNVRKFVSKLNRDLNKTCDDPQDRLHVRNDLAEIVGELAESFKRRCPKEWEKFQKRLNRVFNQPFWVRHLSAHRIEKCENGQKRAYKALQQLLQALAISFEIT